MAMDFGAVSTPAQPLSRAVIQASTTLHAQVRAAFVQAGQRLDGEIGCQWLWPERADLGMFDQLARRGVVDGAEPPEVRPKLAAIAQPPSNPLASWTGNLVRAVNADFAAHTEVQRQR